MSRAAAVVTAIGAVLLAVLGAASGSPTGATSPPSSLAVVPTTVAVAPSAGVAPTTAAATPTSAPPAPPAAPAPATVPRGGAAAGSVAKDGDGGWTVERMATTTGLCIVALALTGFVYGRIRSTPPRHPDLVRSPD